MLEAFQTVATVFELVYRPGPAPAQFFVIGEVRRAATVAMQLDEDRGSRDGYLFSRHGHQSFVQSLRLGSVR